MKGDQLVALHCANNHCQYQYPASRFGLVVIVVQFTPGEWSNDSIAGEAMMCLEVDCGALG